MANKLIFVAAATLILVITIMATMSIVYNQNALRKPCTNTHQQCTSTYPTTSASTSVTTTISTSSSTTVSTTSSVSTSTSKTTSLTTTVPSTTTIPSGKSYAISTGCASLSQSNAYYYLTSNITCTTGSVLTFSTNVKNVVLNCNAHALTSLGNYGISFGGSGSNITIENCIFNNLVVAIYITGANSNITIQKNIIDNSADDGIVTLGGNQTGSSSHIIVKNNIIDAEFDTALELIGVNGIIIENNTIVGSDFAAVWLAQQRACPSSTNETFVNNNVRIVNNRFYSVNTWLLNDGSSSCGMLKNLTYANNTVTLLALNSTPQPLVLSSSGGRASPSVVAGGLTYRLGGGSFNATAAAPKCNLGINGTDYMLGPGESATYGYLHVIMNYVYSFAGFVILGGTTVASGTMQMCFVFANATAPNTTIPLSTHIISPSNGATVSGTIPVTANAFASDGVGLLQIYEDTNLLVGSQTSPLTYSLNTLLGANGQHTLYAKATDAIGNTITSAPVYITVNNPISTTPPKVTIITPANNTLIPSNVFTVMISANAIDQVGVRNMSIYINGVFASSQSGNFISAGISPKFQLKVGPNTVTVTAADYSKLVGQSSITLYYNTTV